MVAMPKPGQFSLACLLVEVSLIAAVIGLARGAFVSWDHSPLVAGMMFFAALVLLGGAYGLLRGMMGASEPSDWPPPQI